MQAWGFGLNAQHLLQKSDRRIKIGDPAIHHGCSRRSVNRQGIYQHRSINKLTSLNALSHGREGQSKEGAGDEVTWIQINGPPQGSLGLIPLEGMHLQMPERRISFGKTAIKGNGSERFLFPLPESIDGAKKGVSVIAQSRKAIGEPGMCKGEVWIQLDCLLKVGNCRFERFG